MFIHGIDVTDGTDVPSVTHVTHVTDVINVHPCLPRMSPVSPVPPMSPYPPASLCSSAPPAHSALFSHFQGKKFFKVSTTCCTFPPKAFKKNWVSVQCTHHTPQSLPWLLALVLLISHGFKMSLIIIPVIILFLFLSIYFENFFHF